MSSLIFPLVSVVVLSLCKPALSAQCACATTAVHVRNGAGTSHTILSTLANTHCLPFKGHRQTVSGASWVNVDYHGQDGWIHEGYVTIKTCPGTGTQGGSGVQLSDCPHIITRAQWGARSPTHPLSPLPATPKYMFIHHGASHGCDNEANCIQTVKQYQNYHMDGHGWSDIGYSFVVGEDGNVYEGRGWDHIGAHTYGYNSVGLAICIIGNFMDHVPNAAALNAVKALIDCGHRHGKITSQYTLMGHRDVGATACPGNKLYELIQHWPHYHKIH